MHELWLDPADAEHMVLVADQGASISLDDGAHWSSWFNQPTAQIYHFGVDDQVPYNLYGTQQDSGALMIASRGPTGIITNHDWDAVGGGESGYLFPRKGDPSIIYGAGSGGNITRYDQHSHVTISISPSAIRQFGGTPTPTGSYYPWNTAFAPSPFQADTCTWAARRSCGPLMPASVGRRSAPSSPTRTRRRSARASRPARRAPPAVIRSSTRSRPRP